MKRAYGTIALGLSIVLGFYPTAFSQTMPAPDELTEFSANLWGASADNGTAAVFNDTSRVRVGSASLRFETNSGFDTWMFSPPDRNANWNFNNSGGVAFWIYAENNNPGFQNQSPWIRLYSSAGNYVQLRPTYDILNEANGRWVEFRIPFAGNAIWQRTQVGSPNLSSIRWIEIHADTWDAGFRYWLDGLRFNLPIAPPNGQIAIAGNNRVSLSWTAITDSRFQQYEIYRSNQPFQSITGMTPIGTVTNIGQTQYEDTTAMNGVRYHYAVALRLSGGQLSTEVDSIGPRTPYNQTDLQVVSIARTPRYPRYDPTYTYYEITEPSGFGPYIFSAATGLGSGQTGNTQRFPAVGSQVTYTATIRNRGTNLFSGSVVARWYVDNVLVSQQNVNLNLTPRQTATQTLQRTWENTPRNIRFEVVINDARPGNNALTVNSRSVGFLSYVDISYYEAFRENTTNYPQAQDDDFIDWLNRHMARFNELFAQAGTPKQVHFEILQTLMDTDPDPNINRLPFAIFPFRYRAGEGSLRLSGYYHPQDDIDYGLLHEMGHQLGLIDLYQMNIAPQFNQVNQTGYSAVACLMNGVSPFLSEHSAFAMTHWFNTAHGYFGQYLYSMPDQVKMRFLNRRNQPLANASVKVYQWCERPGMGKVITQQVKAQGMTNANGEFTLPNVPINPNLVPVVFNGDRLRDNPFGYVAVVGTNGVLLMEIEKEGFKDYAWLGITEVNNAFWQGQTSVAVFERALSLGGAIQTCPPTDMTENNAASWVGWSEDGQITLSDDTIRRQVGGSALRMETTGGFDNYVRYPGDRQAIWNLSGAQGIRMFCYSENPNLGFQNHSPWIRLAGPQGYIELRPNFDILNQTIGQWREFVIPFAGNATWQRTQVGTVSLANIHHIEIHADTWGAGFRLWIDGLSFYPNLGCSGDVNRDGCVNDIDLQRVLFAYGQTGDDLPEDLNQDGVVNDADLLEVLFYFGSGC
ncbi:MAG: hypothetical protein KIT45_09300 [Fimbriimonadia bacterium]|nr:hypothetical protein [Fimbriimonadia bacterium]